MNIKDLQLTFSVVVILLADYSLPFLSPHPLNDKLDDQVDRNMTESLSSLLNSFLIFLLHELQLTNVIHNWSYLTIIFT